jgi:hypothetical protein
MKFHRRPSHPAFAYRPLSGQVGATLSPTMAAIFVGLVLMVLIFSMISARLGSSPYLTWAYAGASVAIGFVLLGVYRLLNFLQKRRVAIGRRDPLLLRRLMEAELEATAGPLRERLDNPDLTVEMVFDQLIQDQLEALFAGDALRFADLRRKWEQSGIGSQSGSGFRRFFIAPEDYPDTPMPEVLLLMERAVTKSHDEGLAEGLIRLKAAHRTLTSFMGDYLDLLPATKEEITNLQKRFPFRPPEAHRAKEMIFAGKFINHLTRRQTNGAEPSPLRDTGTPLDVAAKERVPGLSAALAAYESAWRELLDAYDQRH